MLNVDSYNYRFEPGRLDYDFESIGPKGIIKKVAQFTLLPSGYYNFGFGDVDNEIGDITDIIKSRNDDTEKVLATIAKIIYAFLVTNPNHIVFIKSSTDSRTRLYQMNLRKFWQNIAPVILVWGYCENTWSVFSTGKNYEAFICKLR